MDRIDRQDRMDRQDRYGGQQRNRNQGSFAVNYDNRNSASKSKLCYLHV